MTPGSESIKVAVRVRPFNQRELQLDSSCVISMSGDATTIRNPGTGATKSFTFDKSYWSHDQFAEQDNGLLVADGGASAYADQARVFRDLGRDVLNNAWQGYNATLFAYGQTGSGKSYSMIGAGANRGIVPLACDELFKSIEKLDKSAAKELQVTFSMLEIYNEQIRDLLAQKNKRSSSSLKVRERNDIGFYVEGLSQHPCRNYATIDRLMQAGAINRTTAATNMNATSSRSHMLITIKFSQIFNNEAGESTTKTSVINLVDLAGSERADSTGATGDRLKEGSAINTSLLTLGSVIETLASGDSRAVIPYRDSVLTKLLKAALGGNSRTVMIASLSPADVNYDETMSTLRYANRAKKIKNQAVINESPTDKLIRQLKEENSRLLKLISGRSSSDLKIDNGDIQRLISQNEAQMREISLSWEQKLEQERIKWEEEQRRSGGATRSTQEQFPYLQNVNEDPQLSGVIKHVINQGRTVIGRCEKIDKKMSKMRCIVLRGLGIQEEHCVLSCADNKVTLEAPKATNVVLNGGPLKGPRQLNHGDRLKLGSNALFLYVGFPAERHSSDVSVTKKFDFAFFQDELASSFAPPRDFQSTFKQDKQAEEVYREYIVLMPAVSGVNAMSEEMHRDVEFELILKNLATHDEEGKELPKEILVKVFNKTSNHVWMWSKTKFENRRYLIEELYVRYQENPRCLDQLSNEDDPFWDPIEDVYVGCAHVWLCGLAHCLNVQEQVVVYNYKGDEEGTIDVDISPCLPNGQTVGELDLIQEPTELLGRRFDIKVDIMKCSGLAWIHENSTRGIVIRYKFHHKWAKQSPSYWCSVNPKVNFSEQLTFTLVDQSLLRYFQTCALVVELWGLQAGKSDSCEDWRDSGVAMSGSEASSVPSSPMLSVTQSDIYTMEKDLAALRKELDKSKRRNEELKGKNKVLEKENKKLKKGIKAIPETASQGRDSPATQGGTRVQVELGRALKDFFADIRPVQRRLQDLKVSGDSTSRSVATTSDDLDKALTTLRRAVSVAVRIHKEERTYSSLST